MKKVFVIIALLISIFIMSSCGNDAAVKTLAEKDDRFIVITEEGYSSFGYTLIFYDKHTKVMYMFYKYNSGGGLSPIYNSDGTLMLYDGE